MAANIDPNAGRPAGPESLVDVPGLLSAYRTGVPDPGEPSQRVAFGTSGHRGSALRGSFNEDHILAIVQAICLHRRRSGIDGPLFLGRDTHALSAPAMATALEVLAASHVTVMIDAREGYTPTPAISHAILGYNRGRERGLADGLILTPSHNPPADGGIKYNPPHGGPADPATTGWIERTANLLLSMGLRDVRRIPYERARNSSDLRRHDFRSAFVADLPNVVDLEAIRRSGVRLGIDPLGGASLDYWAAIIDRYGIAAKIVDESVDPTFGFMTRDWDGQIRMDCSSPYAMARLVGLRDTFDVAVGNDPDADRHGIVTRSDGLMNPNHFLVAAIAFLFTHRPGWGPSSAIGKTMVSSAVIDRVAAKLGRRLIETPVGFRWFVEGLLGASLGFAGEESAGAAFLRFDGSVWTTEKDGISLGLLAAEITAKTGRDPGGLFRELASDLGASVYERLDAPATAADKARLAILAARPPAIVELAGEPVLAVDAVAPGNGAPLGGLRVRAKNGWFAVRPSGTEPLYKIYAESFQGPEHLRRVQAEAQALVAGFDPPQGAPR
ncbi:phosphoglucomutase (alpha-D-glucose-1,6-bisphosphate-dependent) [Phenylobacterium soli]|uniref:Phosphoglucomutase n=1 Tax=Phenylobacterium soli TaxID=2170551 RepID=A0A328AHV0_9CAUL|nr:phosphoglucomutase (alpha-D-glucose-1,6-bisphosphate-dependent) [Phenylobacterium soli]RAK54121.1 phosphoglucomutase, alpha-D-glucose phosphate-specific [Phenylobacterium soli]